MAKDSKVRSAMGQGDVFQRADKGAKISVRTAGGGRHQRLAIVGTLDATDRVRYKGRTVTVDDLKLRGATGKALAQSGGIVFRWINGHVVPIKVK